MGKNAWSFALMAVAVGVLAQASSPSSSSSDCTSAITSLSACLTYVITGSNETKPGNDCCTALSAVVSTKVLCLCQVLSANNNLGLPINRTQVLALPGACNVKTPAFSQCAASSPLSSPKTAKTPAKAPAASTLPPTKATPTPLSAGSTSNLPGAPANSPTAPSAAAIFTPSTLLVLAGVALAYLQC